MKKNEIPITSDQAALLLHKMKNPGYTISDLIELMESAGHNAATRTFYTLLIQQACEELFKAIDSMCLSSVCSTGDSEKVENKFFDLNKMLDKLFFTYNEAVSLKGVGLICNQPFSQPESFVWSDEKILKRMYGLLLDNALKYTNSGYIVFGYKTDENNRLILYVSDTGMGIKDEDKVKVFEPLYRLADVLNRGIDGGELGLGTEVRLETEYGKGSSFWFILEQDNRKRMLNKIQQEKAIMEDSKQNMTCPGAEGWETWWNSGTFLRQALGCSGIGFALFSEEGVCLRANLALCCVLGYPEGGLDGMRLTALLHPNDKGLVPQQFPPADVGEVVSCEQLLRLRHASGGYCWFRASMCATRLDEEEEPYCSLLLEDIDQMKKMEESLRESEERYRGLYAESLEANARLEQSRQFLDSLNESRLSVAADIAQLGYWESDIETGIFIVTNSQLKLLRTTAEREGGYRIPMAQYVERYVHPNDREMISNEIQKSLETDDPGYSGRIEYRVIRADGSQGIILSDYRIEKDRHGRTVKLYGVNQDITEQKKVKQELERLLGEVQQSHEVLRRVIDSTPDWIFIKDREYRYQLVNRGYADSLHMAVEDFIGRNDLELGFPEELVKGNPEKGIRGFWADDRLVFESGQALTNPDDPATIDGELHTFHTIKTPLHDASNRVWGVLGFARDISPLKQASQELEKSNMLINEIFNNITIGIIVFDITEDHLFCISGMNYALEKLYGLSVAEVKGKSLYALIPGELADVFVNNLEHCLNSRAVVNYEEEIDIPSGHLVFQTSIVPVFDGGRIYRLIVTLTNITEIRQTKEQLELVSCALERVDTSVLINNSEGRFIYVNTRACQALGYSRNELLSMSISDIDPGMDNQSFSSLSADRSAGSSGTFKFESTQIDKCGHTLPVEVSVTVFSWKEKTMGVSLVRDLSKLRELDELLISAEQDFIVLVEGSPDIIVCYNTSVKCVYVNQAWESITGYTQYGMLDKTPVQNSYLPAGATSELEVLLKLVIETGQTVRQEFMLPHAITGYPVYLLTDVIAERNLAGEVSGVMVVARDITGIKEKEGLLRKKQSILEEAQRLSKCGSWELDAVANTRDWSKETYRIFELDEYKCPPSYNTFIQLVHPDDRKKVDTIYSELGAGYEVEFRLLFPDGRAKYVKETGTARFDDSGNPLLYLGTVQDITLWKESEKELLLIKERAEESSRLKSAFLAIISHEVRTPLNAIIGFNSLIRDGSLTSKERDEFINLVEKAVEKLTTTVDNIIDLAKIESGDISVKPVKYDPVKLLHDQLKQVKELCRRAGKEHLSVRVKIDREYKDSGCISDKGLITRALAILAGNAVKFTREGEIVLGLKFSGAGVVAFYVSDTGIGIPKEKQEIIFDTFIQVEGALSRVYEGLGIGLSAARQIARALQGEITLVSAPGKGSVFTFTVPVDNTGLEKKGFYPPPYRFYKKKRQ